MRGHVPGTRSILALLMAEAAKELPLVDDPGIRSEVFSACEFPKNCKDRYPQNVLCSCALLVHETGGSS
jgi:hypothetical protein